MPTLLHTDASVVFTPTGSAFTGTVIVKDGPVQPPLAGVTVYTAFKTPPVKFRNVSVITPVPAPGVTTVSPAGKLRTHVNVLVNPLVMLPCGSNVKLTFEHWANCTLLLPCGWGVIFLVIVNAAPTHPLLPVGMIVYVTVNVPEVVFTNVSVMMPVPDPKPPVNPIG